MGFGLPAVGVFALGCGDWAVPDSQGTTEPEDMCKICNQKCIEDKFHFIIECITLQGLREQLFLSISLHDASFMHLDNYTKFLYIIQAEHCTAIIAKCVYKMFQLRTSFLYHS